MVGLAGEFGPRHCLASSSDSLREVGWGCSDESAGAGNFLPQPSSFLTYPEVVWVVLVEEEEFFEEKEEE